LACAYVEGATDLSVPDGDLKEPRQSGQADKIVAIQIVPSVEAEPLLSRGDGGVEHFGGLGGLLIGAPRPCVGSGVQLDTVCAGGCEGGHQVRVTVGKQADPDALCLKICDDRLQAWGVGGDRPPVIGGDLSGDDRDQGALMRSQRSHESQDVGVVFTLDIELDVGMVGGEMTGDTGHVFKQDVPLVSTRMDGDPARPSVDHSVDHLLEAGAIVSSRISKERVLVDVHRQQRRSHQLPLWVDAHSSSR